MFIKNLYSNTVKFILPIVVFLFISIPYVNASPSISSFLLNNTAQSITFNPNLGEVVNIEVRANTAVKFTRLYICSVDQICNGTSGNYIRYFTQSDISDSITKTWNGKKSGDTEIVQAGEYKVMVSMTEGTNDPVLEFATYSIFVSATSSNGTTTESNTTNTQATTTTEVVKATPIIRTVYVSAHSNPEDLSNYNQKTTFEVSAGRERMALVGSIIEFDAKYTLNQKDQCNPVFKWSYGDGFELFGKVSSHTYKYPGEYHVVLNASCGEYKSISRTIVKVISPSVSLFVLPNNDLEIINKGKNEINIGGWKIKGGLRDFILSQDTIVSGNSKIIISREDIGENISNNQISLNNHTGREVTFVVKPDFKQINVITTEVTPVSDISIEKAEFLLAEYKKTLGNKTNNSPVTQINEESKGDIEQPSINNSATAFESIDANRSDGFWGKVINTPIRSVKSFFKMFYDF